MDKFVDCWQVTEYVYGPAGDFVGEVHQRRELIRTADGSLRVMQHCQPQFSGSGNVMEHFRGDYEFTLQRDGRMRSYCGPDVIGTGVSWGDDVILGRGVWPRFGFAFTSYGAMATPDRQLTGGRFFEGGVCVACVVGVAQRGADVPQPRLDLSAHPARLADDWHGQPRAWNAEGALLGAAPWHSDMVTLWPETVVRDAGWHCVGRRIGASWEGQIAMPGASRERSELLDSEAKVWLAIDQGWQGGRFCGITFTRRTATKHYNFEQT